MSITSRGIRNLICTNILLFIVLLITESLYAMDNIYNIPENTQCTEPYVVSEIEKKIFGQCGPKLATELVNQLPKNLHLTTYCHNCNLSYDTYCKNCDPLCSKQNSNSLEQEVFNKVEKQSLSLKEEYESINLHSININDDKAAHTINAYEKMLTISKAIRTIVEKKYALISYIIETYLVEDLKPYILQHRPDTSWGISLYNCGLLLQWTQQRRFTDEIDQFNTLYKKNWIRFAQTSPKQPFYIFDIKHNQCPEFSLSFCLNKTQHSNPPTFIKQIQDQFERNRMDLQLAKPMRELTKKEMDFYACMWHDNVDKYIRAYP